jgi:hypothetical protein
MNKNHDPRTGRFSSGGAKAGAKIRQHTRSVDFKTGKTIGIQSSNKTLTVASKHGPFVKTTGGQVIAKSNLRVVPQSLNKSRASETKRALKDARTIKATNDLYAQLRQGQRVARAEKQVNPGVTKAALKAARAKGGGTYGTVINGKGKKVKVWVP